MEITRGDTKALYFQRKVNGEPILTEAQEVYFTIKNNYYEKNYLIQKTLDDMTFDEEGKYHFVINPEDTDKLNYGDYVFDIEVKTDTYTKTIAKGIFKITEEVTFVENEV